MSHAVLAWRPIDAAALPLPISGTYARIGHTVVMAEAREVSGYHRLAYRVTSSTGRTVVWSPVNRPTIAWEPRLEGKQ